MEEEGGAGETGSKKHRRRRKKRKTQFSIFLFSFSSSSLAKMRPLLDELPRTRSSLRVSSQDGGKSSSSSSSRGDAAWNASPPLCQSRKRNQSSFFLALAVAAAVALGLLFGARDALVRGGSVLQSTLASELVERLESQVRGIETIGASLVVSNRRMSTLFFFDLSP